MIPTLTDLFPSSELPSWLPGETFYSLCSRYHAYSANAQPYHTSKQLLDAGKSAISHDFPSRLPTFVQRTRGILGNATEIAMGRTVLRYYFAFRCYEERASICNRVLASKLNGLKFKLGIVTSRFRANHPLKACLACVVEDMGKYGISYWRLEHQYPGMCVCLTHGDLLIELAYKANGVERFSWQLPSEEILHKSSRLTMQVVADSECREQLFSFGSILRSHVESGLGSYLEPQRVLAAFRQGLEKKDLLSGTGRFRWKEIAPSYLQFVSQLRTVPIFASLPATEKQALAQLGRILSERGCNAHPLRRITAIDWIFGSWSEFKNTCDKVAFEKNESQRPIEGLGEERGRESWAMQKVVTSVRDNGMSVTAAAKMVGVDVATAMHWQAQCGYVPARRPKKLKSEVRLSLIADLRKGAAKIAVAERYNVSVSTVTKTLRTEINLQSEWHKATFQNALNDKRGRWMALQKEMPNLNSTELRGVDPAVYGWLYRNDSNWLQSHLPSATKKKRGLLVDWAQRDADLANKIRDIEFRLVKNKKRKNIQLWEIVQQIPELRAKLDVLNRLPITKNLIQAITHSYI